MRVIFLSLAILASTVAIPATTRGAKYNIDYFLIPDEDGNVHYVNINAIPRFVEPIDSNNITFYLYTQENIDDPILFHPHELDVMVESGMFDPNRPSLFNTHGWTGAATSTSVVEVKDAILAKYDFNVFSVDWSGPSHTFYTQAVQYVDEMGDMIGGFINDIVDHYDESDHSKIGLMGHSLGGQVVGRVGYACFGKLAYIIALDPAYPMYRIDDLSKKLDKSDAVFVQVIHANSGMLGVPDSIGHADFHLNGGVKQPECGPDIIGTCSHFLIKDMIAESYTSTYLSWRCDSYEEFLAGECDENETSYWGGWPLDTLASGDYHLRTNGVPPFVIPQ